MAAFTLTPTDLEPFASIEATKALAMIEDAVAIAARVAPCILQDDFQHAGAAKAIIRGAILRWNEAGTGVLQSETRGPFAQTIDTRQQRRGMFWPSEIEQLQELCRSGGQSGAFSIDTVATTPGNHADICALNFGAQYCSCGAALTNLLYPLYEA